MPYISVNASAKLGDRQKEQLKSKMGETITNIPGKTEAVTMVAVADSCALYLGGRALDNGAFIEIRLLGQAEAADKEALVKAVFDSMKEGFSMKESDIYINILELENWGTGGRFI